MAPDTRWNANVTRTATSATLPAADEPDLPDTGAFEVKVKAANTAGDSDWSDPVEATCGRPGPITGLKCSAATDDSVTVSWGGAVGADSFEVQSTGIVAVGLSDIFWEAGGSLSSGHPSIRRYVHTFDSPARGHLYLFGVRAVNGEGDGPDATVKCRTRLSDMLSVECSDDALLAARFSDPFEGNALFGRIVSTISWTSDKAIRFVVGKTASGISKYLNVGDYILEVLSDERVFATIFGPKCLPDGIDAWPERTYGGSYSSEVAGYTFVRNFTIHYCEPPVQE